MKMQTVLIAVSSLLINILLPGCASAFALPLGRNKNKKLSLPKRSSLFQQKNSSTKPILVRGERYEKEGSTIPPPAEIAKRLNVKPTKETSAKNWQRAWRMHKRLIPLLHSTDGCKPPDSSLNLACMWWKALSGNDKSSPVYDKGLAYDLLPSGWRKIIKLRKFYPRLHHGNVELRTAFLDSEVTEIVEEFKKTHHDDSGKTKKIRLICMGAGYDVRGVKMLERGLVDKVFELDLPQVVDAKERLFERLLRRRPWLHDYDLPILISSDFNDITDVKKNLQHVMTSDKDDEVTRWHTIFVFEGVMIYLNEGIPSSLLDVTSNALRKNGVSGSLCFADRLENVPGGDFDLGKEELESNGWQMKGWCPKPGLARHMGSAHLLLHSENITLPVGKE